MAKNLKTIFTILCLLATSVVTVATSKKTEGNGVGYTATPESLARKDYYIASNCPQAIPQDRITVSNELIEYPTNRSFYSYGLPAYNLNLTFAHQITADMNGRQRTCVRSEQIDQGTPLIVYTCSENGYTVCQVSFEAFQ